MYKKVDEHLDHGQSMHVVKFRNEHGQEHIAQVLVGHLGCGHCGAVHAAPDAEFDSQAFFEGVLSDLNESHARMERYAQKHRIPVK